MQKIDDLYSKLEEFKKLEKNWDSYDANPISTDIIEKAKNALQTIYENTGFIPDFVVPCPAGGVQYEHHRGEKLYGLQIEIKEKGYDIYLHDKVNQDNISIDEVCKIINKLQK